MPNPRLNPENISEYLEARDKTKSAFQIFHIDYTQEEKDAIHNFNVKNAGNFKDYNYYGSELNKKDVKEFLEKLCDNSKKEINLITKIIFKLLSNITKGYKKDYYWISIRIVDLSHDFDIPRWHIDGKYFGKKLNQSKFVTVVKGPGTLLKDNTPDVKKVFHPIRDEFRKEILGVPYGTDEWNTINNKYREKFAHELQPFETKQLTNDDGLIFFAGDENSAIHSEPKMDRQRMFISILPGTKEDIEMIGDRQKMVQNGGFYDKYQKYANKLIQFGGGYNYFIENIKDVNDDILKKLDENQSNCWKITEMNSSLNRKNKIMM